MSSGLLALLDDVSALVKVTAASIDDVAASAAKASSKAAGIVIDDAAVTPKYVVGLSPERELPILWNIAKGSLKNKFLYLLPAALLLGWLAPWTIPIILAIGGAYLCFEGYEKIHQIVHNWLGKAPQQEERAMETITPEELEKLRTNSAIRTDFILSAEIMAITYATVSDQSFVMQLAVLAVVAVGITVVVYGAVGVIVKADDVGLRFSQEKYPTHIRKIGRGVIKSMPHVLTTLTYVGTLAMLWVGGGIIVHSVPVLAHAVESVMQSLNLSGLSAWSIEATLSALFGVVIGYGVVLGLKLVRLIKRR